MSDNTTKFKDTQGKEFDTEIETRISDYQHEVYWYWEEKIKRYQDSLSSYEIVEESFNDSDKLSEIAEKIAALKEEYKKLTGKDYIAVIVEKEEEEEEL